MNLWFVRHGPTHAKAMIGWTDLPADLSDHAAIARLRAALPDAPVVSSDLTRAVQTADALLPDTRLPHDAALREINFGAWEGLTFTQAQTSDPALIRAYWETPGDVAPPAGESWHQTSARVSQAIDRYIAQGLNDLIVVAHFGAILTQVQRARSITAYAAFAQKIDNLSITHLVAKDGHLHAKRVNHLA